MTAAEPILRAERLWKVYANGHQGVAAVRGASFEVWGGDVVLLMGPSGSGKSSLLSLCGGLVRPTKGSVSVCGRAISTMPERRLARMRLRKIGFVFQEFRLLANLTALDNVTTVLRAAGMNRWQADARARSLLTDLGLSDRIHFRPGQLSGGEQQRVAIARALANDPALLIADEPTGNLDSRCGEEVSALLAWVARERGAAVLCATHDHRMESIADRVIRIEDGVLSGAMIDERAYVGW